MAKNENTMDADGGIGSLTIEHDPNKRRLIRMKYRELLDDCTS